MATTGPPVTLPQTLPFTLGQGLAPLARCRISYDDVSVSTPSWVEVANVDQRSFESSRGRDGEQSAFDAGTASATFDNRDRAFDPNSNAAIRPFNRIWLYYEFSGVVDDIFKGYVSAWEIDWPGGGWSDATATAIASDEFKLLALTALPTTSPPRATYSDLLQSDNADGLWPFNEQPSIQLPTPVEPNPGRAGTVTKIRPRPGQGGPGGGGPVLRD